MHRLNPKTTINQEDITCPLSQQIFLNPVKIPVESFKEPDKTVIKYYVTVEKEIIEEWINQNGNNPFTRAPLTVDELIPDDEMTRNVISFLEINPDKKEDQYTIGSSTASSQALNHEPRSSELMTDTLAAAQATESSEQHLQARGSTYHLHRLLSETHIDTMNSAVMPASAATYTHEEILNHLDRPLLPATAMQRINRRLFDSPSHESSPSLSQISDEDISPSIPRF